MSLIDSISTEDDIYYSKEFMAVIDSNLTTLVEEVTNSYTVEPLQAYLFKGDLYGLLKHLGVPLKYHYAVMRVNGFRSPSDYGDANHSDTKKFYIAQPVFTTIERLYNSYRSQM